MSRPDLFAVVTPATSLALLTTEELRLAAGVTGDASDTQLAAIGAGASADIMSACGVLSDGNSPPTLLREEVRDTYWPSCPSDTLVLSRRFGVEIDTVVEDGVTLTAADYFVKGEAGLLVRLRDGDPAQWSWRKTVVTYEAGFATVPPELKQAADELVRVRWAEVGRDPLAKSFREKIDDIRETETTYWVGATAGSDAGPVPANIAARLARFMNIAVG